MSELAHLPLRQVLCAGPGALKQLRSCRTWPRVWHWPPPVATRQWPTPPALSSARPLLPSTQKIAGVSKIFDAARGEFALANCDDPALKDIKPRRREHRLCQERGAGTLPLAPFTAERLPRACQRYCAVQPGEMSRYRTGASSSRARSRRGAAARPSRTLPRPQAQSLRALTPARGPVLQGASTNFCACARA